jgi:branched-chain amino acid transport system permease protein
MSAMKWTGLALAFFALFVLPFLISSYWVSLLTQILIFGIVAMSLDILVGYGGMPSFGHVGFFGIGAYVVAILSTRYKVGFLSCSLAGFGLATAVATVFGLLVVHAQGPYFLMITLALGMVLWGFAIRWSSITKGDNGISGILRPDLGLPVSLDDPTVFYYGSLIVFAICLFLMYLFVRSPFGCSLKGIRESESRMRALGYHTWVHRYLGYVVTAAFAGIAGILWAYYNGFVSPNDIEISMSFELFLMVILGGPGTLLGPALGAGVIVFLKNFLSAYLQRWLFILGAIYVLTILYAPQGFVNYFIELAKRRYRKPQETRSG